MYVNSVKLISLFQNSHSTEPQNNDVPAIESMDSLLTREVWNAPLRTESIQMDNERAQQVSWKVFNRI